MDVVMVIDRDLIRVFAIGRFSVERAGKSG